MRLSDVSIGWGGTSGKKELLTIDFFLYNPTREINVSKLHNPTELTIEDYDHPVILDDSEYYSYGYLTGIDLEKKIKIKLYADKKYFSKQQSLDIVSSMIKTAVVNPDSLRKYFEGVNNFNQEKSDIETLALQEAEKISGLKDAYKVIRSELLSPTDVSGYGELKINLARAGKLYVVELRKKKNISDEQPTILYMRIDAQNKKMLDFDQSFAKLF